MTAYNSKRVSDQYSVLVNLLQILQMKYSIYTVGSKQSLKFPGQLYNYIEFNKFLFTFIVRPVFQIT